MRPHVKVTVSPSGCAVVDVHGPGTAGRCTGHVFGGPRAIARALTFAQEERGWYSSLWGVPVLVVVVTGDLNGKAVGG